MNYFQSSKLTIVTLWLLALVGCSASEGQKSVPKTSTTDRSTPAAPPQTAVPTLPEPATQDCPWDLNSQRVVKSYREMGIEIVAECKTEMSGSWGFQLHQNELIETLKVLENSMDLFRQAKQPPRTVRISALSFHSSKDRLMQISAVTSRPADLEDYIHDTLLLMDFEATEFNGEIRFSYVDYELRRDKDGQVFDYGASPLGYGRARADIIQKDLKIIARYKQQILALKQSYPNVRITHGNQFSYFNVSAFQRAYSFSPELKPTDYSQYFIYLNKLQTLKNAFQPINAHVDVTGYPSIDFKNSLKAIDVVMKAKVKISGMDISGFVVQEPSMTDLHQRFALKLTNKYLQILYLYTSFGKFHSAEELNACVAAADFSKKGYYFCDGLGEQRF